MLFCLYGSDSYRRREKLNRLVDPYKKKYKNADILEVDIQEDEDDWKKVRDFLTQPSMFVDSKVAIIKHATTIEEPEWINTLRSQLKTEKVFTFLSEEEEPTKNFGFLLSEGVQKMEFCELEGKPLQSFIKKRSEELHISFMEDASHLFTSFIISREHNLSWHIIHELEKLSLLELPMPIQKNNLSEYIKVHTHEELFSLARGIVYEKNISTRLSSLEKAFLQNEAPAHLFNLVSALVRGSETFLFANYDVLVKSGKIGYEEALLEFAIKK
ncbi:MAG: hypothetical protein AB1333_03475 [Patescibacteria group bacterium]